MNTDNMADYGGVEYKDKYYSLKCYDKEWSDHLTGTILYIALIIDGKSLLSFKFKTVHVHKDREEFFMCLEDQAEDVLIEAEKNGDL